MDRVTITHGGGGEESYEIVKKVFLKRLSNPYLDKLEDASILNVPSKIAYTTDAFTVSPYFFKGGSIGKLAVAGTVNDLAAMGAKPLYMSVSFVIEEGFPIGDLEKIVDDLRSEAQKTGILVVAGDTKVMPAGTLKGIVLSTSGIGEVIYYGLSSDSLQEGDVIAVSGYLGDHGACILAERENFDVDLQSDCASLWSLVKDVIEGGVKVKAMRDPTRGGLASVLYEMARASYVDIEVEEERIPVRSSVLGLCEFLGIDPLHLACEGRMVFIVESGYEERLMEIMKNHPLAEKPSIIGKVVGKSQKPKVIVKNPYGVRRLMEPPSGILLPRIC